MKDQIIFCKITILSSHALLEKYDRFTFCSASPEIIGVQVDHRQADNFFDTIYGDMQIANFLLASLPGV